MSKMGGHASAWHEHERTQQPGVLASRFLPWACAADAERAARRCCWGDYVNVFPVAPSGGDDTTSLQEALDAASAHGPGAVIQLEEGVFRVWRPLVGVNLDVTIRGAGMAQTQILADGAVNPANTGGPFPFQLLPDDPTDDEATALRLVPPLPYLLLFVESKVDRFGAPVDTRRPQRIDMRHLTLGAQGLTEEHPDVSAGGVTQRLFSLVWVTGYRPDWTNSGGKTPLDIEGIDAEHAQVSTVRATFRKVHFDGRNRARGDTDPGGAFDPLPDVRDGFGLEGGFAKGLFKPVNGKLRFKRCRFSDLPGQAGIFAPQLVGPADPAWTFGPQPVKARVIVKNSVFPATNLGVSVQDLSDAKVSVTGHAYQKVGFSIEASTSRQSTSQEGQDIGYPASLPSRVNVKG
jgi:hypothetical protein